MNASKRARIKRVLTRIIFVNTRSLFYLAVNRCRKALSNRGSKTFSSGSHVLYLIEFQRQNRQQLN